MAEEVRRLEVLAEAPDTTQPDLGQDLRALALIGLGITEVWTGRFQEAERHLERGVALARRIGRPFLEFTGLAHLAPVEMFRSYSRAAERSRHAIELAERHGWASDPAAGTACMALGTMLTWQGRLDEAEPWVQRAERTLTAEAQPATGHVIRYIRGLLELARGRDADALAALRAAEPLARRLAAPHYTVPRARALLVHALVRLGETEAAEQALAELGSQDRGHGETRIATAVLRLAQDDPHAAVAALAPVLDGGPSALPWIGLAHAFLLEAIARDVLGDRAAAGRALERALDLAEPDGALSLFLLHPAPGLLEHHARHGTAHAALIAEIQTLLAGNRSAPLPGSHAVWVRSCGLDEQLTDSETRVLRYLPTHLTTHEIAGELCVSVNTVSTHRRRLYAKLGVHSRREAVDRGRVLGLLAPSARRLKTESQKLAPTFAPSSRPPVDPFAGLESEAGTADPSVTIASRLGLIAWRIPGEKSAGQGQMRERSVKRSALTARTLAGIGGALSLSDVTHGNRMMGQQGPRRGTVRGTAHRIIPALRVLSVR